MSHLVMISEIASQKNLSRAAGKIGVTPSTLSHRLAEAERRIGVSSCSTVRDVPSR